MGGFGFVVNSSSNGSVTYSLGSQDTPGTWTGRSAARSGPSETVDGLERGRLREAPELKGPTVIDRGVTRGSGPSQWLAIVRNAWSNEGMVEFYVDGVLTLPFTMPGALAGTFASIGGASVNAAHQLSLPQAS